MLLCTPSFDIPMGILCWMVWAPELCTLGPSGCRAVTHTKGVPISCGVTRYSWLLGAAIVFGQLCRDFIDLLENNI